MTLAVSWYVASPGGELTRASAAESRGDELTFRNGSGVLRTMHTAGAIDRDNPFFQDLGSNGRSCVTCHQPAQA